MYVNIVIMNLTIQNFLLILILGGGYMNLTKYHLSTFWGRLTSSTLCELVELFGEQISWPEADPSKRDRIFNQWRTFWLFLGQVLSVSQTCREVLRKAQAWLNIEKKKRLIQHVGLLPGSIPVKSRLSRQSQLGSGAESSEQVALQSFMVWEAG